MILKNKGVLDSTMLKVVAKVLKNNTSGVKGFKLKTPNGVATVTYKEIIQFVETLSEEMANGNYDELRKCSTCGNFNHPGRKGGKGWCFPKEFTSFRKVNDYCSGWIPMTKEQEYLRRKSNEFGALQTKRAGNGSEDSKQSP